MASLKIITIFFITFIITSNGCIFPQVFSLDDAVKTGLKNNTKLQAASINIQKQEALKLKSIDIPKPEIFMEFEGIKGSISNYESRKIGVLQQLEFPSVYFLKSDVQSSEILISKSERDKAVNDLKLEIKQSYFSLLLQDKLLKAAMENLAIYEDFLLAAERKFDAGSISNLEVLSAKVNKAKFENEIKNIESRIRILQSDLKKLLNIDIDIIPSDDFKHTTLAFSEENLISAALKNNPELNAFRYRKEKYSNRISLSKSELLPDLSVKYYSQKIGSESGLWGFEVGLGIPLWFWWQPSGNLKEADLDLKITSAEEISSRKEILSKLKAAFEDYHNSSRQIDFLTNEAVSESNEILRQAGISYKEGAVDYIEMLQAITLAYDIKVQYLNALYDNSISICLIENIAAVDLK